MEVAQLRGAQEIEHGPAADSEGEFFFFFKKVSMCRFCIRKSNQKKPDQTSGLMHCQMWCYFVLAGVFSCTRTHAKAVSPDPMSGLAFEKPVKRLSSRCRA
jgi:hypothetical protein